jgi:hypothetical protein
MDRSRNNGGDGKQPQHAAEDPPEDPIEKRLAAAKERLREAHQRLDTRKNAIVDPTRRPRSDEDDRRTQPRIILPIKR